MHTTKNLCPASHKHSSCKVFRLSHIFAQDIQIFRFEKRPVWVEKFNRHGTVNSKFWTPFIEFRSKQDVVFVDSIAYIFIKNGYLHLVATKDPRKGKTCSSGQISTLNKQFFLFGKLEIKAKVPTGKGIFPAIWMLREDHPNTFPLGFL